VQCLGIDHFREDLLCIRKNGKANFSFSAGCLSQDPKFLAPFAYSAYFAVKNYCVPSLAAPAIVQIAHGLRRKFRARFSSINSFNLFNSFNCVACGLAVLRSLRLKIF